MSTDQSCNSSTDSKKYNVTVVGIGAMGGGMARALLESTLTKQVIGYDRNTQLVEEFYQESTERDNKAAAKPPTCLREAVHDETDYVILVLLNETQCEQVCFEDENCLLELLTSDSCVIMCSTVTSSWSKHACQRFYDNAKQIHFVDAPTSGGPVRARNGDLTLMVSTDTRIALDKSRPILQVLGRESEIHILGDCGAAGLGSTAKMVHQLLAGVHICVAAEALTLAAQSGIDPKQMYDIVQNAAGTSWMFQDRGQRMIRTKKSIEEENDDDVVVPVKSMLGIFVKDLDICYNEAKRLQSPIPLASAALQQFISGQSLGLSQQDDSQVVKVYEAITGVPVITSATTKKSSDVNEGDNVGDVWVMEDGTTEEILEVGDEPRHALLLQNDYVRALRVSFPPNDTTLAHRHAEDSLYFFLVEPHLDVVNHVKGSAPACDCMGFGEVRFGTHKSDKPLVHKITNQTDQMMLCIDAEVLKQPPVTAAIPLVAENHELIKTRDKCRVYKLTLEPGESVKVSYPFFHLTVVLCPGTILKKCGGGGMMQWTEMSQRGDVAWKEPTLDIEKTNVGSDTFVEFIAEWR